MNKIKKERRSFLKHALAGAVTVTALVATGKTAEAKKENGKTGKNVSARPNEILYRETEAFRKHYKNLYS